MALPPNDFTYGKPQYKDAANVKVITSEWKFSRPSINASHQKVVDYRKLNKL